MPGHDCSPSKGKREIQTSLWWGTISQWTEARHLAQLERQRLIRRDGSDKPVSLSPTTQRKIDLADSSLTGMLQGISWRLGRDKKNGKAAGSELRASIYEWAKRRHQLAIEASPENQKSAADYDLVLSKLLEAISAAIEGNPALLDQAVIDSLPEVKSEKPVTRVVLSCDDLNDSATSTVHVFGADLSGIPISIRQLDPRAAEAVAREHGLKLETRNIELPQPPSS